VRKRQHGAGGSPAFRTGHRVDYQPRLLDHARARAAVEGYEIDFQEGDAESLSFEDSTFDVVLSSCGAMFAPDQRAAARELVRVCRPRGRIGMVNWTPDGWVGRLGKVVGQYVPPPNGGLVLPLTYLEVVGRRV
jgi:ubiquinone/menaquinone biosynthesis C-methylase UbiE